MLKFSQKTARLARFGIASKLTVVFLPVLLIIYFTTSSLFSDIKHVVEVTSEIVKVRFEVVSISQRLIDTLLAMEENQKKFQALGEAAYKNIFLSSLDEYKNNIWASLWFRYDGADALSELHTKFRQRYPELNEGRPQPANKDPFLSESEINEWMRLAVKIREENSRSIEAKARELLVTSEVALWWSRVGLIVFAATCLAGAFYLAQTLLGPLRELRRGIRAYLQEGRLVPVEVRSRDELGDLARTFNDMTKRLTEEEQLRGDFINMLSHELRTPLTSIRESVNLMREGVLGEVTAKQKKFLDISAGELERMSKLLGRLMQVSALGSSFIDVNMKPLDPKELVSESIEKAIPAAQVRGIELTSRISPTVPGTIGDAEHLAQALLNLIGNAIKYSPAGSTIEVAVDQAGGGLLLFSVADQGPGIPEKEQPFVFNKFFRGTQVKRSVDGIGLGLAIAKNIVEAHGGSIWFSAHPEKGTTFYFTVPVTG